jgi:hypothetical protein
MTRTTRFELEQQLASERLLRRRAEARVEAHANAADLLVDNFGFAETQRSFGPEGRPVYGYTPPKGFRAFTAETWAAELEERARQRTQVAEATRRETLEKVIEALELKEYGYHKPGSYYFGGGYTGVSPREGHERLWDDINTALDLRAERKSAETRAAAETRVKRLTKDAYAPGDRIAFIFPNDGAAPTVGVDLATGGSFAAATTLDKPKPAKKKAAKAKKEKAA